MKTGVALLISGFLVLVLAMTTHDFKITLNGLKGKSVSAGAGQLIENLAIRRALIFVGAVLMFAGAVVAAVTALEPVSSAKAATSPSGASTDTAPAQATGTRVASDTPTARTAGTAEAGAKAVVVAAATSYSGPSPDGFSSVRAVSGNTVVQVTCTAIGEDPGGDGSGGILWDYTNLGWIEGDMVSNGLVGPAAPACVGSASDPRVGTTTPNTTSGPFAVVANEEGTVTVWSAPSQSAQPVTQLPGGTFVDISCTVAEGSVVLAPKGNPHADNVWDRIVDPPGWVADSYVSTYMTKAVAPTCP